MLNKLKTLLKLDLFQFVRYNFFCKSVKRSPGHWLIPFRHSVIVISPRARLTLDGNLYLNYNKIGNSKAEAYLVLNGDARLHVAGDVKIRFGSTVQINDGASAEFGHFTCNANINIQCNQRIEIGDDCMIGRNVVIYDSEFHPTGSCPETMRVRQGPTRIGNHVWIQTNAVITRGAQIGNNCIIGPNAFVSGRVREGALVVPSVSRDIMPAPLWARTLDSLSLRERPPVAVPHETGAHDEAVTEISGAPARPEASEKPLALDAMEEKILSLLRKECPDADFDTDAELVSDGILDSLSITTIIAALTLEFGVIIPYEDITEENFNSVKAMAAMMERLKK